MFGPIQMGAEIQSAIDFFGDDYDFADCGDTQIIKYGWWEFFYWTETRKIFGLQNDHLAFDCANHDEMISLRTEKVEMDTWFIEPNQHVTFIQVENQLSSEGIPFKRDKFSPNDEWDILRLRNGITFDFNNILIEWKLDETSGEHVFRETLIKDPAKFLLNGIRFFQY